MKQVQKITTIVMGILMAISACLVIGGFMDKNPLEDGSICDMAILWSIALAALGIIAAAASAAISAASDPKSLLKLCIAVVAAVVVCGILWTLGDDTPLPLIGYEGDQNQGWWLKVSDMGLYAIYLALAIGIISVIASEVYNLFK